jgi:hypothetical protein
MARVKKTDADTPWALKKSLSRDATKTRTVRNIFLIYCEGKNTEPEYFKSFPINTETIVEAVGLGRSRKELVQHIIKLARAEEVLAGQANFDQDRQIWCVFDRDYKGEKGEDTDFNAAVKLAEQHGLRSAYSNDSFELWLVLHYKYLDVKQLRQEYYEYLSGQFGINYKKDGKALLFCRRLYGLLVERQHSAVKNSKRLLSYHEKEHRHSHKNPCTTVHQLVEELNKCLKV